MSSVTRGTEVICSGTFTALDGSGDTPTEAYFILSYTGNSGSTTTSTITMTQDINGVWTGIWDSTLCKEGRVDWRATCRGGLRATKQGAFVVLANNANTLALDP